MRAEQVKGLMEAYSYVYETPEVLNEEVVEEGIEVLDEAPMTAFQAAGGQAKLNQINKNRGPRQGRATAADLEKQGQENLFKAGGGNAAIAKGPQRNAGRGGMRPVLTRQDIINKGTVAAAKPTAATPAAKPVAKPAAATPAAKPTAKPIAATPAAKPTATATPKPTTPAAPAKPAGSAMDQWAKANPKLAAAKAERDRTRGTSATTNPLMKDMKANLPAPKSPSPSTAKTGFDLAKKGVNLAAGTDLFDIVKGHLLDEGYADSEEGAMVIMVNMSEEWRKSILEAHGVELDEAQEAREKPEEHEEKEEKENEKKYGHVRGEKTPMPPRGDKRREEFEKWYAKQGR